MIVILQQNKSSFIIQMINQLVSDWFWEILLICYFLISTFFFCFPKILHRPSGPELNLLKKIISSKDILNIGHRGAAYQHPQNTIQGFKEGEKVVDFLQMDASGTKDGFLVTNHDQNLIRTTGVDKFVFDVNYGELPPFKDKYTPYCADFELKTTNNKIPLLQTVFQAFPKTPMLIELKTPTVAPTKQHTSQHWPLHQLNRLIKKYKREEITIWGTSGKKDADIMYQTNPNIAYFYSTGEVVKVLICFLLGLLPFISLRKGFIVMPLVCEILKKEVESSKLKYFKILFYHVFNFLVRFFLPHLLKRQVYGIFYTLNQKEQYQRAISIGCKGIITDVPTNLNKFLSSRPEQDKNKTS